jgi:hypothetical protein
MNVSTAGEKRLVVVGATGMIGGYALRYALEHPAVRCAMAIVRRKLGISHPKLTEVVPSGTGHRRVQGRREVDGFRHDPNGSASYSAFTDFLGHKDLGEKTILFIIDGLYGNEKVDGPPHRKWKMAPFNDAWPNSIFMWFDGVAIDSVGFDFLTSEWSALPDIANADNYLRESALANDPPSKTVYDPERDGIRCRSLGVNEHWNNATDKKYSRNLGKEHGIELLFQVS